MKATPARTPITMPAMAPPESFDDIDTAALLAVDEAAVLDAEELIVLFPEEEALLVIDEVLLPALEDVDEDVP